MRIQRKGPGGLEVLVQHDGFVGIYSHLGMVTPALAEGKTTLAAGEKIGVVGHTGLTYGMHLYFEMLLAGRPVDPAPYLGVSLCNGGCIRTRDRHARRRRQDPADAALRRPQLTGGNRFRTHAPRLASGQIPASKWLTGGVGAIMIRRRFLLLLAAIPAACASEPKLYTLVEVPGPPREKGPAAVELRDISLAEYPTRTQIVKRTRLVFHFPVICRDACGSPPDRTVPRLCRPGGSQG